MDKRKQIEIQAVERDERRGSYRRSQTQAHRLGITVRTQKGEEFIGALHDLSIGGASAKFTGHGKVIAPGQIVGLRIGSLARTEKVLAKARVLFNLERAGGRYCGFQFTQPAALAKQLDGYYARFFNRRKSPRVGMPLDKHIPVQLFHVGAEIEVELVDLSVDGMQVRAPRSRTKELDGVNHVSLRVVLPGRTAEITGRAAILRRTQTRDQVTLGLAFDLAQQGGITEHIEALSSWIVHRTHEISKWDSALTKPDAA